MKPNPEDKIHRLAPKADLERKTQLQSETTMELKKIAVLALVLFIVSSSHLEVVESDASDCYDACSTACVGLETRERQRCDRKCSIKCGPDADLQAKGHQR